MFCNIKCRSKYKQAIGFMKKDEHISKQITIFVVVCCVLYLTPMKEIDSLYCSTVVPKK